MRNYGLDREIPDSIWNGYLRKYAKQFATFKGEDNITKIKCKFGHVEPFSLKHKKLLFYGDFKTSQKKTYFLKAFANKVEVVQDAYSECVIAFPEPKLAVLSGLLRCKKKRQLTEAQKEVLRRRFKENVQDKAHKI